MKLIFDHSLSIYNVQNPLIYLEAKIESESAKSMFESGWIVYYKDNQEYWYQTQSSRLKIQEISSKRKNQLSKIKISGHTENKQIESPSDLRLYNHGKFEDFFLDDVFWGRITYVEDQVLFSVMNEIKSKKSYGTLSFYYLLKKLINDYEYLYIADYFDIFNYKNKLQGFEYWNGITWK